MSNTEKKDRILSRRKFALVLGINAYEGKYRLENAENDAEDMASTLKSIGFSVTKKINLTTEEMDQVLLDFKRSLSMGDMVLFYFAGHGIQWEVCIPYS